MEKAEHLALIFPNGRLGLRGKFGCSPQSLADRLPQRWGAQGGERAGGGMGASQAAPATGPAFCGPEPPSRVPPAAGHSWEQASLPVLLRAPGVLQTVGVWLAQLALCAPRPPMQYSEAPEGEGPAPLRAFGGGALTFIQ